MADKHLATYLNDHLAGSTAALELLEQLSAGRGETPLGKLFAELQAEIEADRRELESLMEHLDAKQSLTRQASAWFAEKLTEFKLHIDDPAGDELRLLESLEALSLGIEGKLGLWRALAVVAPDKPALQGFDYERLSQRATEQRRRVEEARLAAARQALLDG